MVARAFIRRLLTYTQPPSKAPRHNIKPVKNLQKITSYKFEILIELFGSFIVILIYIYSFTLLQLCRAPVMRISIIAIKCVFQANDRTNCIRQSYKDQVV